MINRRMDVDRPGEPAEGWTRGRAAPRPPPLDGNTLTSGAQPVRHPVFPQHGLNPIDPCPAIWDDRRSVPPGAAADLNRPLRTARKGTPPRAPAASRSVTLPSLAGAFWEPLGEHPDTPRDGN